MKEKEDNPTPFVSNRWKKIFEMKDNRMMWKAIGWNGEPKEESSQAPSDLEFKIHFEELLNPMGLDDTVIVESNVNIPLLDDVIETKEVEEAIASLNSNKSYVGVDTGFLKILPIGWIMFLTTIFNSVFFGSYPLSWCFSKLIVLFKKGLRYLCGNYRQAV